MSFTKTITVYDFNDKQVKTYVDVPIPENPSWKSDIECLHYLKQQCPKILFNGVYAIQPYHNEIPLNSLEGAIYPEIQPEFRTAEGWDLKCTAIGVDISMTKRMKKLEDAIESLNETVASLNTTTGVLTLTSVLKDLKITMDDDFAIVHPLEGELIS